MGDVTLFRPGDRIAEKYVVERELGRGGMAVVVAARHAELGNEVAIKALHPEELTDPVAVERLMREARAAAKLQSEHATKVFDVGRLANGAPFLVLERLRGMDLHALIEKNGPLTPGQAARAVYEACDAVAEAHESGIIHRDLKPSNLFLAQRRDGSTTVKVLDFGIAKASGGLEESGLTTTSSSLGTPLYMPPEQILDAKSVTPAVDVWALGVTLYELVTDAIPWDAQNVHALLAKILTEKPVPLRSRLRGVSAEFEAIVERCMARSPGDRFRTARELGDALAKLADAAMAPIAKSQATDEATDVDLELPLQVAETDVVPRPDALRDTTTNPLRRGPEGTAPQTNAAPAATRASVGEAVSVRQVARTNRRRGFAILGIAGVLSLVGAAVALQDWDAAPAPSAPAETQVGEKAPPSKDPPPTSEPSAEKLPPPEIVARPAAATSSPSSASSAPPKPSVRPAAPAAASSSRPPGAKPSSVPSAPAPRPSNTWGGLHR